LLHDGVIDHIDDHFTGGFGIDEGMLNGVITHPAGGRKNKYGGLRTKNIKVAKRTQIGIPFFVYRTGQGDGPGRHCAQQQLMSFLAWYSL